MYVIRAPAAILRRCTFGVVRMASMQVIPQGPALVLAVQPLESWRELWVIHETAETGRSMCSTWAGQSGGGYVDLRATSGNEAAAHRAEVKEGRRFRRSFEELRLDDLALVRQASSPELLRDFGRWQDISWRKDTLALH